jgi:hypothetical protein
LAASVPDELASAVAERRAILFAGAGLSMSVGLPSWQEFIHHLSDELGLEPAEQLRQGMTYHTIAEYYRIQNGSIGPLRSWMDRNWNVSEERIRESRLHKLVLDLHFPLIYTTNYDRNIEAAFDVHKCDYVKVANARDIAQTREGMTQIIKFHGDFEDDASLVIAETDYFNRLAFDAPLDIKFRADALGKTVLFVGYSMTDINIRLLLHNLRRTWQESGFEADRPKSFVFLAGGSRIQEVILRQWGVQLIGSEIADPEEALVGFLESLRAKASSFRPTA